MTKGLNIAYESLDASGNMLAIIPTNDSFINLKRIILTADTDGDEFWLYARDQSVGWKTIAVLKVVDDTPIVVDFAGKELRYFKSGGTDYEVSVGDTTESKFMVAVTGTGSWYGTLIWRESP